MSELSEAVKADIEPQGSSVSKDLFAGTVAGWAQVLSGQPFDAVKVRLQTSSAYCGTLDCVRRIVRDEGALAFYKGTVMPLVGIGACVSLQFAFLQAGKRQFAQTNKARGKADPESLSLGQLYLAGAGAGIGNSVASGPVEHVRIRLQIQTSKPGDPSHFSGPLDVIKKIYKTDGIRGVYQGQVATVLRELHGYGMYFLTYEWLVQRKMQSERLQRNQIPMLSAAIYGAVAGVSMWLTNYPLDVIKSRLQTDALPSTGQRKYLGTFDCARKLYAAQGPTAFVNGIVPTLLRAPFVNAATFVVFELVMRAIA